MANAEIVVSKGTTLRDTTPATMDGQQPASTSEPYFIRITSSSKIKAVVSFALDFLEKNEDRPVVLHTCPLTNSRPKPPTPAIATISDPTVHRERIPPSLSTLPRLITVAEIIKREYLKLLAAKGSSRRLGLYQYNQLRILERNDGGNARVDTGVNERRDDEMDVISELDDDLERAKSIVKALEGKHFPKRKQMPHMRITLSLAELPQIFKRGVTQQRPLRRKFSKSAKARAKKREKKEKDPMMT